MESWLKKSPRCETQHNYKHCKSNLQVQLTSPTYESNLQVQLTNPTHKSNLQVQLTSPTYKSNLQVQLTSPTHKSNSQVQLTSPTYKSNLQVQLTSPTYNSILLVKIPQSEVLKSSRSVTESRLSPTVQLAMPVVFVSLNMSFKWFADDPGSNPASE
jgi:hypothetical protein